MTTAELAALLETPEAFRAWLAAKEPREVVGRTDSGLLHPIASWSGSLTGESMGVGRRALFYETGALVALLPYALGAFDDMVSSPRDKDSGHYFAPITAAECLAILDAIGGEE
jgi:hypothetical protein